MNKMNEDLSRRFCSIKSILTKNTGVFKKKKTEIATVRLAWSQKPTGASAGQVKSKASGTQNKSDVHIKEL